MMPTTRTTTATGYAASDPLSEEFSRRRIYLTTEITDAVAADVCCQINQLAAQSDEDITLWIMSPGGSVTAGLAILDTIKACGCDIRTVVMGCAASMAAVLASSGTRGKRAIGKNGQMMIHQALGGVSGQTVDIIRTANHIQKTNNRLYAILAENTGASIQQITVDCDRDFYLDAAEAISYGSYGLADYVFNGFDD